MTHDTTQSGQDDQDAPAAAGDAESLPEILEVFGAAPLVPDMDERTDDDSDEDVERDAQGRFVSRDESDDDDHEDSSEMTPPEAAPSPRSPWASALSDRDVDSRDTDGGATSERLDALQDVCERLVDQLSLSEQRLGRIETSVDELARQTSFLPPKLRGLGSKVDDLTHGLGDERTRGLLEDVVAVLDLVDGAREQFGDDAEPRRYLDAVATRIGQILEGHKVREIDADGEFDPELHHAIERVSVDDASQDGRIVSVVRRGWSGGGRVLRYADVTVGALDLAERADDAEPEGADAPDGDAESDNPTSCSDSAEPVVFDTGAPDACADEPGLDVRAEADDGPTDLHELDASSPPPGEAPKTVTDTDSASITFRPTQRRNRG